ncbi:alpha/beta hydrolase [Cereibacter sphaeroides]|nr:alpha/beta hydrolase [Cereibacter sphaeroides]
MPVLSLADGHALAYAVTGPEGAPWLVLGNSLMTTQAIWADQVAAFSGRFRVLTWDQRGHGGSAVPEGPLDMATLAADLVALCEALDVTGATYVGLSMGVPTGLTALPALGDRVSQLVLVDGLAASSGAAFWDERIAFAGEHGMAALAAQTAERWLPSDLGKRPQLASMIAGVPLEGFTACAYALRGYDARAAFEAFAGPVLLIAGEADARIVPGMQALADSKPGARLALIAGAGHLPCFEAPEAFNALLAETL